MLGAKDAAADADDETTTTRNPAAEDGSSILDPATFDKEDTDAVVSRSHKQFFLTQTASAFVALAAAVPYVAVVQLTTAIVFILAWGEDSSPLRRFADLSMTTGLGINLVACAASLRLATAQASEDSRGGELVVLGAGTAKISQRANRGLRRAHTWLLVPATLFFMVGLMNILSATRVGTRSKVTGRLITVSYARAMVASGLTMINMSLVFFPWWHTLKSASALVAEAVAETRKCIESISPTSPQWKELVLPRVMQLCDETLPMLSRGWGYTIGIVFLGWWATAAGFFAAYLETEALGAAMLAFACVLFPLGISYDTASASSDCDLLVDPLNKKRMQGDDEDQGYENSICRVELILDRQNTKQGLGLTVFGRVMDLKTLGNILAGIAGVASTAVPILFSLRPSKIEMGDQVCALTAVEVSIIQSGMLSRNESCTYNVTLDEVLGM